MFVHVEGKGDRGGAGGVTDLQPLQTTGRTWLQPPPPSPSACTCSWLWLCPCAAPCSCPHAEGVLCRWHVRHNSLHHTLQHAMQHGAAHVRHTLQHALQHGAAHVRHNSFMFVTCLMFVTSLIQVCNHIEGVLRSCEKGISTRNMHTRARNDAFTCVTRGVSTNVGSIYIYICSC